MATADSTDKKADTQTLIIPGKKEKKRGTVLKTAFLRSLTIRSATLPLAPRKSDPASLCPEEQNVEVSHHSLD